VGILSGGEKARLALARMLLVPAGLLLLDEPTNHLDMASREVLTEALRQFEGSIVFISHDRHLINAIATKVIEVRSGRLTHYLGDWEYYSWKSGREAAKAETRGAGPRESIGHAAAEHGAASGAPVPAPASEPGGRVPSYRERKEIQRRYRQVEKRILQLEARRAELAGVLADPQHASDYELLFEASEEATRLEDELGSLYPEWEGLSDAVSSLD
jgi:ATP-binding cassette subfamily F protein 3